MDGKKKLAVMPPDGPEVRFLYRSEARRGLLLRQSDSLLTIWDTEKKAYRSFKRFLVREFQFV